MKKCMIQQNIMHVFHHSFPTLSLNLISTLNKSFHLNVLPCSPLPMWRRVFSMVEFRLTLESNPRQKRFLLLEGSVKPSTRTLVEEAW